MVLYQWFPHPVLIDLNLCGRSYEFKMTIRQSTGVYYIIPPMSFSILVGLALDYDIFLMSRVVEFRKMVSIQL